MNDAIRSPAHYARLSPQPRDVIAAWGLNFNRGSALKYIARAGNKGDEVEDLEKAIECLRHEVEMLTARKAGGVSESKDIAGQERVGDRLASQERQRIEQAMKDGRAWAYFRAGVPLPEERPTPSILDVIASKTGSRRVANDVLRELEARGLIRETAP